MQLQSLELLLGTFGHDEFSILGSVSSENIVVFRIILTFWAVYCNARFYTKNPAMPF